MFAAPMSKCYLRRWIVIKSLPLSLSLLLVGNQNVFKTLIRKHYSHWQSVHVIQLFIIFYCRHFFAIIKNYSRYYMYVLIITSSWDVCGQIEKKTSWHDVKRLEKCRPGYASVPLGIIVLKDCSRVRLDLFWNRDILKPHRLHFHNLKTIL